MYQSILTRQINESITEAKVRAQYDQLATQYEVD